jgi:hypothetical protein
MRVCEDYHNIDGDSRSFSYAPVALSLGSIAPIHCIHSNSFEPVKGGDTGTKSLFERTNIDN